jgi:hypothetical protein
MFYNPEKLATQVTQDQRKKQTKKQKKPTQCALNRISFVCGNHNTNLKHRHLIGEHKQTKKRSNTDLPVLPVSLDCPFCVTSSVFSIIY